MKSLELSYKIQALPKFFKTLTSRVQVNGVSYANVWEWFQTLTKDGNYVVVFNPYVSKTVKIVVKASAQQDTPFFHFNAIYNNGQGIPLTEMIGCRVDERENMVKMDLWNEEHTVHWIGWILKSKILQEVPYEIN